MKSLRTVSPGTLPEALMENELLRYEVRHLRARLEGVQADLKKAQRQLEKSTRPTKAMVEGKVAPGVAARNQQAYDDIVWLVGRLNQSPVGGMLRRWGGFRVLLDRYTQP